MGRRKGGKAAADAAAADDDAALAEYLAQQEQKNKAEVKAGVEVTPRANAVWCADEEAGRVYLFAGECFSGETTKMHSELYSWDVAAGQWSEILPAGRRGPCGRCGHQGVLLDGGLFVFGGEKVSRDGCDITHLADLWRFDLKAMKWTDYAAGQSVKLPSARSGHRMTALSPNSFVVFGGYYDTGKTKLKKFNDLHLCVTRGDKIEMRAVQVAGAAKPATRSACCLGGRDGTLCVYGGVDASMKALQDMWIIRPQDEQPMWHEVSFEGGGLGPRAGISIAVPAGGKNAVFFGGLSEKGSRKKKETTFHSDLWQLDLATRKFQAAAASGQKCPRGRMSAGVCACRGKVYVYGGVVEIDEGQETLGDLWSVSTSGGQWKLLAGDPRKGAVGEDESESEVSDGVDDVATEDGLEFGYGVDPPLHVPRRLQGWSKGAVGVFNSWHYAMMNDVRRNDFYDRSLRAALAEPGLVVDVGAGGGLLSLLAARAGAPKVVAVEARSELAAIATENAARNGLADRVTVLNQVSTDLSKDDLGGAGADVIVHELFGALLLGERSLRFVADVRDRLGAPGCRVVPQRGVQYVTLISCPAVDAVTGIQNPVDGLDLRYCDVLKDTCGLQFTKTLGVDLSHPDAGLRRLSDRVAAVEVDYSSMSPEDVELERVLTVPVRESGTVSAVMLTWEAAGDGVLNTEPGEGGAARAVAWGQALQLVEDTADPGASVPKPVRVTAGSSVRLAVRLTPDLASMQCEVLPDDE